MLRSQRILDHQFDPTSVYLDVEASEMALHSIAVEFMGVDAADDATLAADVRSILDNMAVSLRHTDGSRGGVTDRWFNVEGNEKEIPLSDVLRAQEYEVGDAAPSLVTNLRTGFHNLTGNAKLTLHLEAAQGVSDVTQDVSGGFTMTDPVIRFHGVQYPKGQPIAGALQSPRTFVQRGLASNDELPINRGFRSLHLVQGDLTKVQYRLGGVDREISRSIIDMNTSNRYRKRDSVPLPVVWEAAQGVPGTFRAFAADGSAPLRFMFVG